MSDPFKAAAKVLEDEFFAKRDAETRAAFREKLAREAKSAELAAASGIDNEEILEQLHALDIGADTFAALALVPLIEVAWADGTLDGPERDAILRAAREEGFEEGRPGIGLLQSWLASRPGPELRAAWYEYVRALCKDLSSPACADLKANLLGRARSVAEASGGFLGFGRRVSPAEEQVISDLMAAFPG